MASPKLLEVKGLKKYFPIRSGILRKTTDFVKAVDGIDFDVYQGETLGIVGESGSGKSTAGRTMMRLYEPTGGTILFKGNDITHLPEKTLRRTVRREMQMVFQDPFSSLNPRKTIGTILKEPLLIHKASGRKYLRERVAAMLEEVGIPPEYHNRYPHQFSGGQRQRIGLARALMLEPDLIIADEPVSALDVSVQAQIIHLIQDLQSRFKLSIVFISHDLSVVRHICDRVAVMYRGKIVELGQKEDIYRSPSHAYTQRLLSAVPTFGKEKKRSIRKQMTLQEEWM